MRRSRLTKNVEKKTKKTIVLSIIGILIVLFLLFKFGIDLVINFSVFLSGSKTQNLQNSQNTISFIEPPTLNPLLNATNSAQITISGKSLSNRMIYLYMNNQNIDQISTDNNGNFSFNENLNSGDNQIKTKAEYKGKQSDFSDTFDIVFKNSAPSLNVNSPTDGQSFSKDQNTVNVTGKSDPGITITVNGFWAVIDDNNNFSYTLPLQNGDNEVKIVATDQAGNKTEKDLKVNYSQ